MESRFVNKSQYQGFLMIALNLLLPYAVVGRHPSYLVHIQEWLFPFGKLSYENTGYSEIIKFATPFQYYYLWFLNIIAIIWVVLGLLLTVVVMRKHEDNEHANQAIPIALFLLALQLIVTLAVIPLVFSGIRNGVIYVIPLPIPFLVTILLLVNWKDEEVECKDIRVLNKPYYQGFLILVSSLVFPCVVMESGTWIGTYNQYWIFPFGVYIHDYGQWLGLGRFLLGFPPREPFSSFSIIAVIWVVIGLILAVVVIGFRGRKKLTKKLFTILILLLTLQIVVPIVVILLVWQFPTYIFPLPIPFLIAILLLRREGIRFMRESYFQGFLIFVSSLMLPFAVVGSETHIQELYFPFGVLFTRYFGRRLILGRFYMLFFPLHSSSYFNIIAVIWVVIGLILAAEVITLLGSKKLTKKIFTILILLLTLQIVVPIVVILLVYGRSLPSVLYVIPLPIPFLVAILLLERSGVTLMSFKNIR